MFLRLNETPNGIEVTVEGGGAFLLPLPSDLKKEVEDVAVRIVRNEVAAELIRHCEFEYEIVRGKGIFGDKIGMMLRSKSPDTSILRDEEDQNTIDVWSSISIAFPDLGDGRVVVPKKRDEPKPVRKKPMVIRYQKQSTRELSEQFITELMKQGRHATALGEAAQCGNLKMLKRLIKDGLPVDGMTEFGSTPLMQGASGCALPVVRFLIRAGADVNAVDSTHSMTPLMWSLASMHSNKKCVPIAKALIEAGASNAPVATNGLKASDWAAQRESDELIEIIASAGTT